MDEKRVFITGVSSGIGFGLAKAFLASGWRVWGASRRRNEELEQHQAFRYQSTDLAKHEQIVPALRELLEGEEKLDLVVLNAGILGAFGDMRETSLGQLREVMDINLWSIKSTLDAIYSLGITIDQAVTISSGASVNGSRGWSGYAISKAALNMMTKLYAAENQDTHFCALAPGVVDTEIQDEICGRPADDRFPSIENLKSKRNTDAMPLPTAAGQMLRDVILRLPQLVKSGDYADIRQPPIAEP